MTITTVQSATNAYLTAQDVAEQLRIPLATLYKWRVLGGGPNGHFVGRHLRFKQCAIDSWYQGGGNKAADVAARMLSKAETKAAARG